MTKGLTTLTLVYTDKVSDEMRKRKDKKGLSWEDYFLWTSENTK